METTEITAIVANAANPLKSSEVTFRLDSGVTYSVVPKSVLQELGVRAHSKRTFTLADGSAITRHMGDVIFRFKNQQGASPVVFGEEGDSTLIGIISLGALGFVFDPIRRELRPLPMKLGTQSPNPPSGPVAAQEDSVQRPLSEIFDRYDETILHGE